MSGLFYFTAGVLAGALLYIVFLGRKVNQLIEKERQDKLKAKEIENNVEKDIEGSSLTDLVDETNKRNGFNK